MKVAANNVGTRYMRENGLCSVIEMRGMCQLSICPNRTQKERRIIYRKASKGLLVVISTFVTPLDGSSDASLPVLHPAASENREGRQIVANEAHALGLNNGVDDDRVPNGGE